ncbi:Sarcosine oxidase subunit beta [bioreactor metagenome]|jgi:sarcosine oxidase subunit beta|uniref:Sarcosine oxidase subunit beta n=1 Tax=bioreactor metagenome TaxID=1076179 RepID=A0A644Y594_9ZZZZ|nr:FAD-binding oxidoreductase [Aminivibrio sp.]MEA4953026.1 FAD-binding oxidoreductase [Aminivibrio sp.]
MMEWKNTADVVIIGGGIIGVSTAYYLAQNGMKNIVLIEKGTICGGSTGRCGAGIRAQWGTEMNCRLGIAALDIFEQLDQDLGMSVGLNQGGYLLVAYSEKELDTLRKGMELQNSLGIKSRQITLREAREICPGLAADDAVGFFFHGRDGHADPFLTTFAYLEAAKRLGVTCHRHTECTGILVDGGAVRGVETDRGIIHAPIVINCAGAYAQFIARMAGIEIPNWAERHEIMITEPVAPGVCPCMLMSFSGNYYIQQRPHGSIICGMSPAGHPEDYENKTTWQFIEEMSKTLVRLLPRTRGIRIARQWSGMYDMTPDAQPIIGETDVKNFYHSTGYSGHGFMLAPVAGKILAQHITGKKPDIDFSMLDYRRFARGEHIRESNVV